MTVKKSRNIVMWLRSTNDHAISNFRNRKVLSYNKFFKEISKQDNFRLAFDFDSYIGNGKFKNVAIYKSNKIIMTTDIFKADVIYQYNKMVPLSFSAEKILITNTPEFRNFCSPKINTYNYMPEFFPKTYLALNKKELLKSIGKIKTKKVVLKPNKGSNGDHVYIFDKNNINIDLIPEEKLYDFGFLIQEFIDTSTGIPTIASSYHDLRIITHGSRISLCHIRQPQKGSLVSNSHKGALITEINIDSIPKFILDFYHKVHNKIIKKYPYPLYSMDIGIDKDGPKLIELNSHTAFPGDNFKCMNRFINNLIYHLETIE